MRPGARIATAAELLDQIIGGAAAGQVLTNWARASRYAGSGDRAGVRDLVFDALRRRGSWGALGGGDTGRALMLGRLREMGQDPGEVFTGARHDLSPLSEQEMTAPDTPAAGGLAALDWPAWLADQVQASLGQDFAGVSDIMRARAPVFLRVNTLLTTPGDVLERLENAGIEAVEVSDPPNAIRIIAGERKLPNARVVEDGLAELQDLSSQAVVHALGVKQGAQVLDYCAGGGGKSLALAAGTGPRGRVDTWDANPRRMADLPGRAERAGAPITILEQLDPDQTYPLVLCDAPCSGSGAWRRDPQGKWTLTQDLLDELRQMQQQVLDGGAAHVAPGGRLAYVTCSILDAENSGSVDLFLSRHPEWHLVGTRRWLPLIEGGDGFFLAQMSRKT